VHLEKKRCPLTDAISDNDLLVLGNILEVTGIRDLVFQELNLIFLRQSLAFLARSEADRVAEDAQA
jgi:hypothetical protein